MPRTLQGKGNVKQPVETYVFLFLLPNFLKQVVVAIIVNPPVFDKVY